MCLRLTGNTSERKTDVWQQAYFWNWIGFYYYIFWKMLSLIFTKEIASSHKGCFNKSQWEKKIYTLSSMYHFYNTYHQLSDILSMKHHPSPCSGPFIIHVLHYLSRLVHSAHSSDNTLTFLIRTKISLSRTFSAPAKVAVSIFVLHVTNTWIQPKLSNNPHP